MFLSYLLDLPNIPLEAALVMKSSSNLSSKILLMGCFINTWWQKKEVPIKYKYIHTSLYMQ
jgi:hypothetical protein